jgi:hypothetical protein
MRCGTPGTSWHVTTKSSLCDRGVLYKSGAYVGKALCLTPGDLHDVRREPGLRREKSFLTVVQKSAEGIVEARASKARTV